jgi:hypothetical protein
MNDTAKSRNKNPFTPMLDFYIQQLEKMDPTWKATMQDMQRIGTKSMDYALQIPKQLLRKSEQAPEWLTQTEDLTKKATQTSFEMQTKIANASFDAYLQLLKTLRNQLEKE